MNNSPWMPYQWRLCLRAAAVGLLVGLICLLSACGGGETEEEHHKDTHPVNCQQRPELCK